MREARGSGLLGVVALAGLLLSCHSSKTVPRLERTLLEGVPTATLTVEDLLGRKPIREWSFHGADQRAREPMASAPSLDLRGGELVLEEGAGPIAFAEQMTLRARRVFSFLVEARVPHNARMELWWARKGEEFSGKRVLRATGYSRSEGEGFRFDVGSHPLWSGRISRLGFGLLAAPRGKVTVISVAAFGLRRTGRLAKLAGRPRIVEVAGDWRYGQLMPSGRATLPEVTIPRRALLRFSLAWLPRAPAPYRYRVGLETGDGEETLGTGGPVSPATGWAEEEVDLSEHAGKEGRLFLEVLLPEGTDARRRFAAVANPELGVLAEAPPRPNVVLLSIDTLRADRLSSYGHSRPTSPRIDAWTRREGILFRNAVAAAPWTLPSHASIFSGLDQVSLGLDYERPMPPRLTFLAELLRDAGYRTAAVTGGTYLHPAFGLHQGFQRYRVWEDEVEGSRELEEGVSRALDFLRREPRRPFFLFFHTYEVHSPFLARRTLPPGEDLGAARRLARELVAVREGTPGREPGHHRYARRTDGGTRPLTEEELALLSRLYDAGVAFADEQIGRLLEGLTELGLREDTLVVLTSDHGEALGERGLAGHAYLYDFNMMVPLIVGLPGREAAGERVTRQVRSVDVLPTILDVVDLPSPAGLDGRSLLPLLRGDGPGPPASAWSSSGERGIALRSGNRLKYILDHSLWRPDHEEIFDLRADPDESRDLSGERSEEERATLRALVLERYARGGRRLRVDLRNGSGRPFELRLRSEGIRVPRVKTIHRAGPRAAGSWERRGRVRLEVPDGCLQSLFLEALDPRTPVHVFARLDGGPAYKGEVVPGQMTEPWPLGLHRRRWRPEGAGGGESEAAIVFFWEGDTRLLQEEAVVPDARLRARLEALGYLE